MKHFSLFRWIFPALLAGFFICKTSFAQQKDSVSTKKDSAKIIISGYVDAYYAYYTDSVGDGSFQKFPSVCPRSGFGLNTAMLTAQYDAEKIRGIVALQFGDIPLSSWSGTYNNIMEAHVGVRLCKKLWFDAGFFRTHFGTEGLLPKENIASSISVNTFYEPYYESGFRLNYNPTAELSINAYVLNGYNIYEDNNSMKSFGLLATYALGDKGNIGYSNYIGDDTPTAADSISHLRFHNNLFFNYQFGKLKMQLGGDYCMQENGDTLNKNNATMFSGVLGLKYQLKKKFAVYTREEIFNDPQGFMGGIIIDKQNKQTGLKLWGVTAGVEYKPTDNSYVRLEARQIEMDANQEIFRWKENEDSRLEILFHFGVSF
ncbi:MAG: porin [Bacteroidetes bacterium]|nr:porin [Bacteroidota bacterium]